MGQRFQFTCPDCNYQTMVSGSDDRGFLVATTTILCETCRELYDVAISDEPWAPQKQLQAIEPVCKKNSGHQVRRWTHPGPCPKCGQQMSRADEDELLWD